MQLRRALLVLLMVMVVSAFAASLVRRLPGDRPLPGSPATPTEEATGSTTSAGTTEKAADDDAPTPPKDAEQLELRAGRDRTIGFEPGTHLVVTVSSKEPGQAFIDGLGQVLPVTPGTPARFDLLLDRKGTFRVLVRPIDQGDDIQAGTIKVAEPRDEGKPRSEGR
jgi:hypothetical protein